MVFLHLLRWLRANAEVDIGVVLVRGGPLVEAIAEQAPTVVVDGSRLERWVLPLHRRGLRLAPAISAPFARSIHRRTVRPDVLYASTAVSGEIAALLAPSDVPVVAHVHELKIGLDDAGAATARLLEVSSRFVVPCVPAAAELGSRGVERGRIAVIPEPVVVGETASRARARDALGLPPDAVVVGAVGTPGWRKGTDLFPQLARLVGARLAGQDVLFVWIGGSPALIERELGPALRSPLFPSLRAVPEVPDAAALVSALDVLVLPSREDPLPLVVLESALRGVPAVVFSGGGIPDLLQSGVAVVDTLDLHGMADAVVRWVTDEDARRAAGAVARARVTAACDINVVGPRLLGELRAAGLRC